MKKSIFTFFALLVVSNLFAISISKKSNFERYDKLVHIAMFQFKDKDYKNSLRNFQKAFTIIPDDSDYDYFYAASAALNLKNEEEAKRLIIQSIIHLNANKGFFLNFKEFDPFRSVKLFAEIENDYPKYQAEFFKNLAHPEIYQEIEDMFQKDQDVRNNRGDILETDAKNINRLIEITKKYGWQKRGAWTVLWHQRGSYREQEKMLASKPIIDSLIAIGKIPKNFWTTDEDEKWENNKVWSFFKPYIDDQIAKGNMRKDFWAMYEDEASVMINKTQIYGMYWSQFDEHPIMDIENVDKRRKSMGMPPLWYMNKVYNAKLPKEYNGIPNIKDL